jgi:hypothetical protein
MCTNGAGGPALSLWKKKIRTFDLACGKKSEHMGYYNRMQKVKIMKKGNNNLICNIPDSSV